MSPVTLEEQLDMDKKPYKELVGGLLYLVSCTRPDIAHAVGMLARFMDNPGTQHWEAAKYVLRYLKGTSNLGVTYTKCNSMQDTTPELVGYSDSDYAGCLDTRKSTTGYLFFINQAPCFMGIYTSTGGDYIVNLRGIRCHQYRNSGVYVSARNPARYASYSGKSNCNACGQPGSYVPSRKSCIPQAQQAYRSSIPPCPRIHREQGAGAQVLPYRQDASGYAHQAVAVCDIRTASRIRARVYSVRGCVDSRRTSSPN